MELEIKKIGVSTLGQSIDCWNFNINTTANRILIVGGVHGDECEGIEMANELIKYLHANSTALSISIIPCLNRDGQVLGLRSNVNDVDLNRNLPTENFTSEFTNPRYKPGPSPSSENETKAFIEFLNSFGPSFIVSLHSFSESLLLYSPINGQFDSQIENLSASLSLNIKPSMDYKVTGSLNTLSKELGIPTLTVEAPRGDAWIERKSLFINTFNKFISGFYEK